MTALSALTLLCAVLALLHARRRREHLPVAALLAWVPLMDGGRVLVEAYVLGPARAVSPLPYEYPARVWWFVAQALEHTWPAAIAAAAAWVFLRVRLWPALVIWAGAMLVLCSRYPELRGEELGRVKAWILAGWVMLAVACAAWNRQHVQDRWEPEHVVVGLLLAGEGGALAGMLAVGGAQTDAWYGARAGYWGGFVLVAAYEVRQLWKVRRQ